jgi:hypothetical protein
MTDRQYVTAQAYGDSTYYTLGEIDRREISLRLRAELALTPRLSLELYAQPLVSAARYPLLNLAADPRADVYTDRLDPLEEDRINRPGDGQDIEVDVDRDGVVDFTFGDPDFRIVSLRTSAVLRWEFRPGSTLFVVWQQDRRGKESTGDLRPSGAIWDTFEAPGVNVFALKVAYWLGR